MSHSHFRNDCTCAGCSASRRDFLKTAVGGLSAASALSSGLLALGALPRRGLAEETPNASETFSTQLFKSLNDEQKKIVCFPFDHPLRSKVDNNWHIIKKPISAVFTKDQRDLIRQIFLDMHSEEYRKPVMQQVEHDNADEGGGGFEGCAVAMFGEPGSKFEFVFTGRHVTRRCDGNSVEGEAFGGPIFYGHAAQGFNEKANHPGNIYWYQAKRANELFQALDGKQRKMALRNDPRSEQGTETVALRGTDNGLPGIPLSELSPDQKQLAWEVMHDILAPFRKTDANKAMQFIKDSGVDKLHMAFYSVEDIGNDGVWDLWQIEGPSMVWYFRGAPHVHTWVHVREPQAT
ncbi:MAG TPA: DUF3500 domain-containing protein [Tepidisphaeraceae bacterium]|nr:DUF3500 domain-containing protein [Tepidisphaeraceae bacterium]